MLRSEGGLDPVTVDFGLSAFVEAEDYLFYRCGTPGYVAPEITTLVKGQRADPVCDVFSAGVIFHILLTKRPLFEGTKFEEVYENNRKMRFNLNSLGYKKLDPEAMDLLEKMLKIDPRERIKPDDILHHPFLYGWVMEDEKEELSPTSTLASCRKQEAY
jgi:calcium-dependent protein kinase